MRCKYSFTLAPFIESTIEDLNSLVAIQLFMFETKIALDNLASCSRAAFELKLKRSFILAIYMQNRTPFRLINLFFNSVDVAVWENKISNLFYIFHHIGQET